MTTTSNLDVGVVGVGSMGRHHARVYSELPTPRLVGVADANEPRAAEVAADYDTGVLSTEALLEAVDAVSVAVPTEYHSEVASAAIERGCHVLVEKPLADTVERGAALVESAAEAGVTLQVGHVERFNPAIRRLRDVLEDVEVLAVDARRLGPPVGRDIRDDVVWDLMIHDIDVLLSILGSDVASVDAARVPDEPHVAATVRFAGGAVGTLTASRITQKKIRELSITARDCLIEVDYIGQSVRIHRRSVPAYIERSGDVRYRHEGIIEKPTVNNGEPLKAELESFVDAILSGDPPVVSGEDGLRALELAREIQDAGEATEASVSGVAR